MSKAESQRKTVTLYIVPRPNRVNAMEQGHIKNGINQQLGLVRSFNSSVILRGTRMFTVEVMVQPKDEPKLEQELTVLIEGADPGKKKRKFMLLVKRSRETLERALSERKAEDEDGTENEGGGEKKDANFQQNIDELLASSIPGKYVPVIKYNFERSSIEINEAEQKSDEVRNLFSGDTTINAGAFFAGTWVGATNNFVPYWPPSSENISNVRIRFEEYKNTITLTFNYVSTSKQGSDNRGSKAYVRKLQIDYGNVKQTDNYIVEKEGTCKVYLSLKVPPACYSREDIRGMRTNFEKVYWFAHRGTHPYYKYVLARPVLCIVLRLESERVKRKRVVTILRDIYKCREAKSIKCVDPKECTVVNFCNAFERFSMKFGVQFGILSLVSQGIYSVFDFTPQVLQEVSRCKDQASVERALNYMSRGEDNRPQEKEERSQSFIVDFRKCYEKYVTGELQETLADDQDKLNLAPTRRVYLTPTFPIFRAPEMEPTNRVLRNYMDHADYFMRLNLVGDNCEQIQNVGDKMYQYYREILLGGIPVGTKRYLFLAFSNSQLRGI